MRHSTDTNSKVNKPGLKPSKDIVSLVAGLVVMVLFISLLTHQSVTMGKDYIVRSNAIAKLRSEGRELLADNRLLRMQKAFVMTIQGKIIIARRFLYKYADERYYIVTIGNPK